MAVKILKHDDEKCTQCHQCEMACSKAYFKEEDVKKSRIQVREDRLAVCNQCGECIKVCSEKALSRNNAGVVMLDKNKCVGCLVCVGYCPSLTMHYYDNMLVPFKCVACGICVRSCPTGALSIAIES